MAERVLTLRELNRATLTRQFLLERASLAPLEAIKQLAGLQAQLSNPPYIGLWSRLHAFQRNDLTHLLEQRQVVRTSMMRRTLHLTTAEDYMRFRPALQSLHTRDLNAYFTRYQMNGLEKDRLITEIQAVAELRYVGIKTKMSYGDRSPKAQMKQANTSGAAYALIIGENELANNIVSVRDLQAGSIETEKKQIEMPPDQLLAMLSNTPQE